MQNIRFLFWRDGDTWLGYLEEYPDYMTQGKTFEDLKDHLRSMYKDLAMDVIPCVRKVAEFQL